MTLRNILDWIADMARLVGLNSRGGAKPVTPRRRGSGVLDKTPTSFSFAAVTGADRNEEYRGGVFTVSGLGSGVSVPVTVLGGGRIVKNGALMLVTSATATNGDTLDVELTSAAAYSTALSATLTVGGASATFTVTTEAEPSPSPGEPPAEVTDTVSSAAELTAAMSDGAVIFCEDANYGDVTINTPNVTIVGGRGAVFTRLNISGAADLTIEGVTVSFALRPGEAIKTNAIRIAQSPRATLRNCYIAGQTIPAGFPGAKLPTDIPYPTQDSILVGYYAGRAITVEFSADVTVEACEITGFFSGISFGKSPGLTVEDNDIHHLRTTPIKGGGLNLVIRGNASHHSTPWRFPDNKGGDHLDGIHLFTGVGAPCSALVEGNLIDAGDGFQLILMLIGDNGNAGIEVEVKDNVGISGNTQGISLSGGVTASVTGNVMIAPPGSTNYPTIIPRTATLTAITGNTVHERSVSPGFATLYPGNTVLPRAPVTAERVAEERAAWEAIWRPA